MNIKEIGSDTLRYPFRDWKKILFLGSIIVFSNIADISAIISSINVVIMYFLVVLGYIIGFFWERIHVQDYKVHLKRC